MLEHVVKFDDSLRLQLRGFAKSLVEIEWLMLVLALLYLLVPGSFVADRDHFILGMVLFASFIIAFHYANFFRRDTYWKLALEIWAMTAFITLAVWQTGRTDSVLLNLYLLVIIASALTLSKFATLLQVALIAACYFYFAYHGESDVFSLGYAAALLAELAPFLLVAYLTTMLASDVHHANARIHVMAGTDELTGLMNMRGFMGILHREHTQAQRYAREFTLAMIDVDNLKRLNDENGHETGNRAIQQVAGVLRENLRESDAVARFGGDEFVLLLSGTNRQGAGEVIERIRRRLDEVTLVNGKQRLPLEISIGLASYPENGGELQQLLAAADVAMYEEKQAKREAAVPLAEPA
jgi:diguanylate cyclase (GGDEF)-like protein